MYSQYEGRKSEGSSDGEAGTGPAAEANVLAVHVWKQLDLSLAGLAQGALNGIFGTSLDFKNTWWASILGGNSISGTLFGSGKDAAESAASTAPGLVGVAMGTVTTYGRRTSTIAALNIAGKGGLPQALGDASSGLKGLLGATDNVLSLGLDFTTKIEIDAAITAAETAYCAYKTE